MTDEEKQTDEKVKAEIGRLEGTPPPSKSKSVNAEAGEQIFTQMIDGLSRQYGTKKIIAMVYVQPENVEPDAEGNLPCINLVAVGDPDIDYDAYAGKVLSLQGQIWNNIKLMQARNSAKAVEAKPENSEKEKSE